MSDNALPPDGGDEASGSASTVSMEPPDPRDHRAWRHYAIAMCGIEDVAQGLDQVDAVERWLSGRTAKVPDTSALALYLRFRAMLDWGDGRPADHAWLHRVQLELARSHADEARERDELLSLVEDLTRVVYARERDAQSRSDSVELSLRCRKMLGEKRYQRAIDRQRK